MNCIDLANALQIAFKMGRETGTTPATREEVQQQFNAFVAGQSQNLALVLQSLNYWKDVASSRAATPAHARCANGPIGCDYPRCDCNGASTKESNQ